MARVVFAHSRSDDSAVDIFRNFGEDVGRELQHEKRIDISLGEIDRCVDRFEVRTKPALVSRVTARVRPIIKKHLLEESCTVTVED